MNYRMILSLLGDVLLVIGAFLLLPCIVAVIYGEPELWVLLGHGRRQRPARWSFYPAAAEAPPRAARA